MVIDELGREVFDITKEEFMKILNEFTVNCNYQVHEGNSVYATTIEITGVIE